MAQIGGANSNFEKRFNSSISQLEKSIQYRTDRISSILAEAYRKPQGTAVYWNEVRRQLNAQYKALGNIYNVWASKNIPMAYRASVKELMTRLNRSKDIASRAKRTYTDLVTSSRAFQITNTLYRDAMIDWTGSLKAGQANLNRITRRTQQILVKENLVDNAVSRAIESGNLMNNTFIKSINMPNTLAAQLNEVAEIIDGEKYVIAGKSRFKPKYYAEMVSRVKFHEAQAYGAVQTATNYGTSLVQVSSHNTTTAICQEFEGKIFSIKGKDDRFPVLIEVPPFHPNCLHLLYPMFASSMELEGSMDDWVAFSNGDSSIPPSPSSFKPFDERKAS